MGDVHRVLGGRDGKSARALEQAADAEGALLLGLDLVAVALTRTARSRHTVHSLQSLGVQAFWFERRERAAERES